MKKLIIILVLIIIGFGLYTYTKSPTNTPSSSEKKSEQTIKSDDWTFLTDGTIRAKDSNGKVWSVDYTSKNVVVIDRGIVGEITEKIISLDTWVKQNKPFRTENYSGPGMSPSTLYITGNISGNTIVATKLVDEGQ